MKTVAIIQARMGSSRLPGKMLMDLCGYPVLHWVLSRVKSARKPDQVILATTTLPRDDALVNLAAGLGVSVWRGSEENVLSRFIEAGREAQAGLIVRVCADNPFVAPEEIDRLIEFYQATLEKGEDPEKLYAFNHIPALDNRYPDGLGAEIFALTLLEGIAHQTESTYDREHVTVYLWKHLGDYDIRPVSAPSEIAYPQVKLDVDTQEDLNRLRELCGGLSPKSSAVEVVRAYLKHFSAN